jgi:mpaB/rubber oxygenase-like protein
MLRGMSIGYRRRLGFQRDPAVRAEIAALDSERDCQRIAHLLVAYEFPWDMQRALELALFHTYGSASVARLLDRTGEFQKHGQKRYDDTQILIGQFIESGWDGDVGARAIARMNEIHRRFSIPNDDFLFVLWTFIDFPIRWADEFAWRPFTAHERAAWFAFWCGVGKRMGLADIPNSKADFDAFIDRYERVQMVYSVPSANVAEATLQIMRLWLPESLRPLVQPVVRCLMSERLRAAFGFAEPSPALRAAVRAALRLRGRATRVLALGRYPSLIRDLRTRTYGHGPYIPEKLGP